MKTMLSTLFSFAVLLGFSALDSKPAQAQLILDCDLPGTEAMSCQAMGSLELNFNEDITLNCTAEGACANMDIVWADIDNSLTVYCTALGACENLRLSVSPAAPSSTTSGYLFVSCETEGACGNAEIQATSGGITQLDCYDTSTPSCGGLTLDTKTHRVSSTESDVVSSAVYLRCTGNACQAASVVPQPEHTGYYYLGLGVDEEVVFVSQSFPVYCIDAGCVDLTFEPVDFCPLGLSYEGQSPDDDRYPLCYETDPPLTSYSGSGGGEADPVVCPAGQYNSGGSCVAADPGYFTATDGATDQTACAVGYFQPDPGQSSCLPSPTGAYVAEPGSAMYTLCEPGTYQDEMAQTSCKPAPAGTFVAESGSTVATLCEAGTYQDETGQSSCKIAPAGTFVAEAGAIEALACPEGTTSEAGAVECTPVAPPPPPPGGGVTVTVPAADGISDAMARYFRTRIHNWARVGDSLLKRSEMFLVHAQRAEDEGRLERAEKYRAKAAGLQSLAGLNDVLSEVIELALGDGGTMTVTPLPDLTSQNSRAINRVVHLWTRSAELLEARAARFDERAARDEQKGNTDRAQRAREAAASSRAKASVFLSLAEAISLSL